MPREVLTSRGLLVSQVTAESTGVDVAVVQRTQDTQ